MGRLIPFVTGGSLPPAAEAAPESEETSSMRATKPRENDTNNAATATSYVMVDVLPIPLSWLLVRAFMGPGSKLASILVTSRDAFTTT
jgi:hypothetical protein